MSAAWLVLKFGGTSVSDRAQWERIAALARQRHDEGHRVVLVCSAVSGITDALQGLVDHAADAVEGRLDEIKRRHLELVRGLGVDADDLVDLALQELSQLLQEIADSTDDSNRYRVIASLFSIGEWLSTKIGARFLSQRLPVGWVDVREALQALPEADRDGRRSRLSARCDVRRAWFDGTR